MRLPLIGTVVAIASITGCAVSDQNLQATFARLATAQADDPEDGELEPGWISEIGTVEIGCRAGWSGIDQQQCGFWSSEKGVVMPVGRNRKVCKVVPEITRGPDRLALSSYEVRLAPDGSQQDVDFKAAACGAGAWYDQRESRITVVWHVFTMHKNALNATCDYKTTGGVGQKVILC